MQTALDSGLGLSGMSNTALRRNPRLVARLHQHGVLLMVAGSSDHALSTDDAHTLRELSERMLLALPIVFGQAPLPRQGFYADRMALAARELLAPKIGRAHV